MNAQLFGKTGEVAGVEADVGDELTIGRSAESGLVLEAEGISPHHAHISWDPEASSYRLKKAADGVSIALDGVEVEAEVKLGRFHVITLGAGHDLFFIQSPQEAPRTTSDSGPQTVFSSVPNSAGVPDFSESPSAGASDPSRTEAGSRTLLESVEGAPSLPGFGDSPAAGEDNSPSPQSPQESTTGGRTIHQPLGEIAWPSLDEKASGTSSQARISYALEVEMPGGEAHRIVLSLGENKVGRSPGCAVRLDNRTVSREHAIVTVGSKGVLLRDLSDTNPSRIDGTPIEGEVPWEEGTVVEFGLVRVTIVSD